MLSDNLEKTIKRAISYAIDRQQEYVTLEHLLLALIDDKDALGVLNACDINIKNLKISLLKYIDQELKNITSAAAQESEPSASFQRVLQRTTSQVYSSDSNKITGANVLVSIFSERESHAVYFLQKQDMSRLDALNFISHGIKKNENETEEEIEEEIEGFLALHTHILIINERLGTIKAKYFEFLQIIFELFLEINPCP